MTIRRSPGRPAKAWIAVLALGVLALGVAACGAPGGDRGANASGNASASAGPAGSSAAPLRIVTSFSILTDLVATIGGNRVQVHNLVPIGTDPHEYEPLPADITAASAADALFYSGLNLEGGEHGWFFRLAAATGQDQSRIFEATAGVEPMFLDDHTEVNPHAFLDPNVGMTMTANIRDALTALDPASAEHYTDNADAYLDELADVDARYREVVAAIPDDHRVLVTSERAYQYVADRYGLREGFIWAVDTDENGSPAQITALIDFLRESSVPALFVESNVDRRPMETISAETGIPIAGVLFSDEIGRPGDDGDTYLTYLQHNIAAIGAALGTEP